MRFSDNGVTVEGPLGPIALADVWPKGEEMLARALERDGWKVLPVDLLKQASDGELGLYSVTDDETGELLGMLGCESYEYPHATGFNIAYCGGHDLHRWAGLLGAMEQEAASLGCDTVRITGRPGWGRIFPDYREMNRVFERKVVVEQ